MSSHHDPVATVVLWLALVLVAAKLAGDLAVRLRQPAVLGELLAGVLLGNLSLVGLDAFSHLTQDGTLDMLARLGVIVLLFQVGLESTVAQMLKVGWVSLRVAVVGVLAPAALGFGAGVLLLPDASVYTHLFLGAALCATSVGITARVLQDLGASKRAESRIILGAAVLDDVLGLVVLAVVAGVIAAVDRGESASMLDVLWVLGKAIGFLGGALALGIVVSSRLFQLASTLKARDVLLATGLSFCFLLAWAADAIGLAPIVGAFAAGLVLEEVHYRDFKEQGEHGLEELMKPISGLLVPVFFVLMGARTDLRLLANLQVLLLASALTIAAIAGKLLCGAAVGRAALGETQLSRISVGVGMIPRGEVGLIFANIGLTLTIAGEPVISGAVFSACVVMVIVTTMITPPLLRLSLSRAPPAPAEKMRA